VRKLVVAVVVLLSSVVAASAETVEEFDRKVEQELRAMAPSAVAIWQRANAAREAGRHPEAVQLYEEVWGQAPNFVHALRRMAHEEQLLGKEAEAQQHMREALKADRSSQNLVGMASLLLWKHDAVPADYAEAAQLAVEAEALDPNELFSVQILAEAAARTGDQELLRRATTRLEALDPKSYETDFFRQIVQANDGEWSAARASLDRALAHGMPKEAYAAAVKTLEAAQPWYVRWGYPALRIVGVWFVVFALLLVAGVILSRVAMRAAQEPPAERAGNATGLSGRVRAIYAAVMTLSCVFYYVSIPIVILLLLAAGGGVIYGFVALGHIPVKLIGLVAVVVIVSVVAMLKSLFIRVREVEPGMKLDLAAEPRLRQLLDDVAAQIGTRAVDNVYMMPGTEVAVMERGKRHRERCLLLGVAALEGFRMLPFKAVLAHEYGHFSNRDTAGGAFALSVRRSLGATAVAIARGGAASWYNPAWLFVYGFNRVFLRISEGASRLQEILADRWAVFAFGAAAFEEGLRHVIERSVRFDAHVGATLKEVIDRSLPLANLYTYTPAARTTEDFAAHVEERVNATGSVYDSHPPAAQRFALAHALPKLDRIAAHDDDSPAWTLFANPEALQFRMTAQVRANVQASYGVEIAG
jgi:Zn-dependent protease with chaperone function